VRRSIFRWQCVLGAYICRLCEFCWWECGGGVCEWRRVRSTEESEGAAVRAERARTSRNCDTAITPLCQYGHCAHACVSPAVPTGPFIFYMAGRECDWSAAALSLPLPSTAHPCTSATIAHQSTRTESPDRLGVQSMMDRVGNGTLSLHGGVPQEKRIARFLGKRRLWPLETLGDPARDAQMTLFGSLLAP